MAEHLRAPPSVMDLHSLRAGMVHPALILHDPDDEELPVSESRALAEAWPESTLSLVSGVGHRRILREPSVISSAVRFIADATMSPMRRAPTNQERDHTRIRSRFRRMLRAFEEKVEHQYVSNGGVGFHYAATGTGPLIVFLHGFPDHWLSWRMLMADLKADYRVVAIDVRGYNLSDEPLDPQAYEISQLVGDVRTVIAHEGATRAAVVGHDCAVFVAWYTAMDIPTPLALNVPHPWAIARELANKPSQRNAARTRAMRA